VLACHDISEGGLVTTLAEMSFGGDCGVDVNLAHGAAPEQQLFNETAGQFVVEVPDEATAQQLFGELPYRIVGRTKQTKTLSVRRGETTYLNADLDKLKAAWKGQPQEVTA